MVFVKNKPVVLEDREGGKYIGKLQSTVYNGSNIIKQNSRKNELSLTEQGAKKSDFLEKYIILKTRVLQKLKTLEEKIQGYTSKGDNLNEDEKEGLKLALQEAEAFSNDELLPLLGNLKNLVKGIENCIVVNAQGKFADKTCQTEIARQEELEIRQKAGDFLILYSNAKFFLEGKQPKVPTEYTNSKNLNSETVPIVYLLEDNHFEILEAEKIVNLEKVQWENELAENNAELSNLNRKMAGLQHTLERCELDLRQVEEGTLQFNEEQMSDLEEEIRNVRHDIAAVSGKIQVCELNIKDCKNLINQAIEHHSKKISESQGASSPQM